MNSQNKHNKGMTLGRPGAGRLGNLPSFSIVLSCSDSLCHEEHLISEADVTTAETKGLFVKHPQE
jgi:hypothetical protein